MTVLSGDPSVAALFGRTRSLTSDIYRHSKYFCNIILFAVAAQEALHRSCTNVIRFTMLNDRLHRPQLSVSSRWSAATVGTPLQL